MILISDSTPKERGSTTFFARRAFAPSRLHSGKTVGHKSFIADVAGLWADRRDSHRLTAVTKKRTPSGAAYIVEYVCGLKLQVKKVEHLGISIVKTYEYLTWT